MQKEKGEVESVDEKLYQLPWKHQEYVCEALLAVTSALMILWVMFWRQAQMFTYKP